MSRRDPKEPSGRSGGRRGGGRAGGRSSLLTPQRVTMLVLAALAVVLIAENTEEVRIRLVVPVVIMPLYLALLVMFVLGGLCGALFVRSRGK